MELVDVLFPQNIGSLTYGVPEELRASLRPGLMVEADVRGSIKHGIVMPEEPDKKTSFKGKLKQISGIA